MNPSDYASVIRQLTCHKCKKYISGNKLKVDESGNIFCTNCKPNSNCTDAPIFELLLKEILFPCNNNVYGCQEQLIHENVAEHEKICQYKDNPKLPTAARRLFQSDTISLNLLNSLKCPLCKNYLNVPPIRITERGDYFCGRCPDIYLVSKPIRHYLFEDVAKLIKYPCKYMPLGCKAFLSWERIIDHEVSQCKFRLYNCPTSSLTECEWNGVSGDVVKHVSEIHPEYSMKTNMFTVNRTDEKEIHVVMESHNEVFIFMTKVDMEQQKLFVDVCYLGDGKLAKNYKYSLKFCDSDSNSSYKFRPINGSVKNDMYLKLTASSPSIPFKKIFSLLDNITKAVCIINISFTDSLTSVNIEKLVECSTCDHIGLQEEIQRHKNYCSNKLPLCKFNCGMKLPPDTMAHHADICNRRTITCKWPECGTTCLYSKIEDHEKNCSKGEERIKNLMMEVIEKNKQIDTLSVKIKRLDLKEVSSKEKSTREITQTKYALENLKGTLEHVLKNVHDKRYLDYIVKIYSRADKRTYECFADCSLKMNLVDIVRHMQEEHGIKFLITDQGAVQEEVKRDDDSLTSVFHIHEELIRFRYRIVNKNTLECYAMVYAPNNIASNFTYEVTFQGNFPFKSKPNIKKNCSPYKNSLSIMNEFKVFLNIKHYFRNDKLTITIKYNKK